MKDLKTNKFLILVIGLMLLQIGCSKKDKRTTLPKRGTGPQMTTNATDPKANGYTGLSSKYSCSYSSSELNGFFYVQSDQEDQQFKSSVKTLLSNDGDPVVTYGLSDVSARCGANTGVRFMGDVQLESGFLNNSNVSGKIDSRNSFMGFVIFDAASATEGVPGIGIGSMDISGQVNGNQATLYMSTDIGREVELNGTFVGQEFRGTIYVKSTGSSFRNFLSYFSIPKCEFFHCQ